MSNYAPHAPAARRSRTWLWIVLAAATLVIGLVVGRWAIPTGSSSTPGADQPGTSTAPGSGTVAAPHGPAKITQGVPSGYTHDRAGAATAGVNAVQVVVNVAHGQADPDVASSTWTASNADAGARQALAARPSSADQTSKLPATTRVTAYSDTAATVEVWVVSVGSSTEIGGGTNTAAKWSTHTIGLTWENGDWKVSSLRAISGPQPGDNSTAPATAPLTNGLYTYYIN